MVVGAAPKGFEVTMVALAGLAWHRSDTATTAENNSEVSFFMFHSLSFVDLCSAVVSVEGSIRYGNMRASDPGLTRVTTLPQVPIETRRKNDPIACVVSGVACTAGISTVNWDLRLGQKAMAWTESVLASEEAE